MPACFNLTKKGATEPAKLALVDEEICQHMGVEVHPSHWCLGWYHIIGLAIACGHELGSLKIHELVARCDEGDPTQPRKRILAFLEANYTSNNWRE